MDPLHPHGAEPVPRGDLHDTIAGDEDPFVGAYGFYASAAAAATEIVVSTWVIDQPRGDNWVELFRLPVGAGRTLP